MNKITIVLSLSLMLIFSSLVQAQDAWPSGIGRILGLHQEGMYTYVIGTNKSYQSSNLKDFYKISDMPKFQNPPNPSKKYSSFEQKRKFVAAHNAFYILIDVHRVHTKAPGRPGRTFVEQNALVSLDKGKTWQAISGVENIMSITYNSGKYFAIARDGRLYASNNGVSFGATGKSFGHADIFSVNNRLVIAGDKLWMAQSSTSFTEVANLPNRNYQEYYHHLNKIKETYYTHHVQHPDHPNRILGLGYYIIVNGPVSATVKSYGDAQGLSDTEPLLPIITSTHYYQLGRRATGYGGVVDKIHRIRLDGGNSQGRMFQFDAGFEEVPNTQSFDLSLRKGNNWYVFATTGGNVYTCNADNAINPVDVSGWKMHETGSAAPNFQTVNPSNQPIQPVTKKPIRPKTRTTVKPSRKTPTLRRGVGGK